MTTVFLLPEGRFPQHSDLRISQWFQNIQSMSLKTLPTEGEMALIENIFSGAFLVEIC